MDTMFIRNAALAGAALLTARGVTVQGDARGVFCVPREFGERLCKTPGWSAVDEAPAAPAAIDPTAALRAALVPAVAPPVAEVLVAVPTPPAPPAEAQDALVGLSQSELLSRAAQLGLPVGKAQKRMQLEELRSYVAKALAQGE